MSAYTDFLNLFKWNPQEDAEEEFDIDKALNDNWDKIDVKLKDYITSVNCIIENFKTEINTENLVFKEQIENEMATLENMVSGLSGLINQTQSMHTYTMTAETDTEKGAEITLPFYYKVGNGSLHQIQFENWVLLKAINVDTEGQYYEVGQAGSVSNKIKLANDAYIKAR